jgi:hypothetical protein
VALMTEKEATDNYPANTLNLVVGEKLIDDAVDFLDARLLVFGRSRRSNKQKLQHKNATRKLHCQEFKVISGFKLRPR